MEQRADAVAIRRCGVGDAHELAEIGASTFHETYDGQIPPDDLESYVRTTFTAGEIERTLGPGRTAYFLAELGGRPVGYLKLNLPGAQSDLDEVDALEIESIYVGVGFQGLGIGRRLIDQAVAYAVEAGLRAVWLGVWEQNEKAIAFYERLGFRRFGTHAFELGRTRNTDVLMRLEP